MKFFVFTCVLSVLLGCSCFSWTMTDIPGKEKEKEHEHESSEESKQKPAWSKEVQSQLFHALISDNVLDRIKEDIRNNGEDPFSTLLAVLEKTKVDLEAAREALENGANPSSWEKLNFGLFAEDDILPEPLWIASEIGNKDLAQLLLTYGANPNAPSAMSLEPLSNSISQGFFDFAQLLLGSGAHTIPSQAFEALSIFSPRQTRPKLDFFKLLVTYGLNLNNSDAIEILSSSLSDGISTRNSLLRGEQNPETINWLRNYLNPSQIAHLTREKSNEEKAQISNEHSQQISLAISLILFGAYRNSRLNPSFRELAKNIGLPESSPFYLIPLGQIEPVMRRLEELTSAEPLAEQRSKETISYFTEVFTLAAAYSIEPIIEFIIKNNAYSAETIILAFNTATAIGDLPILKILRFYIPHDALWQLINNNLQIAATQLHIDIVQYFLLLANELGKRIDIISVNNFISNLLRDQLLEPNIRSIYLHIQSLLWDYVLNQTRRQSYLGQIMPETLHHIRSFVVHGQKP